MATNESELSKRVDDLHSDVRQVRAEFRADQSAFRAEVSDRFDTLDSSFSELTKAIVALEKAEVADQALVKDSEKRMEHKHRIRERTIALISTLALICSVGVPILTH